MRQEPITVYSTPVMAKILSYGGPPPTEGQLNRAKLFLDVVPETLLVVPGSISNPLTARQTDVYSEYVAVQGQREDVGRNLYMSVSTVRNHIKAANRLLKVSGVERGVLVAEHHGFIEPFLATPYISVDHEQILEQTARIGDGDDSTRNVPVLSGAELNVVQGFALGLNIKQIYPVLGIAEKTVKNHSHNAYGKLDCAGKRINLITWGVRNNQVLTARRLLGHLGMYGIASERPPIPEAAASGSMVVS